MALKLGAAAGRFFRRDGTNGHRVVIGKDTRLSGYMLENALTAGLTSTGMNVLLLGPVPTPAVGFLTTSMRADLGIMISASHNPSTTTASSSSAPTGSSCPTAPRPDRGAGAWPGGPGPAREYRPRAARGRGAHALCGIRQDDLPARAAPDRAEDRGRLRKRRGLSRGAGNPVGTGRRGRAAWGGPERAQHQRRRGIDRAAGRRRGSRGAGRRPGDLPRWRRGPRDPDRRNRARRDGDQLMGLLAPAGRRRGGWQATRWWRR